MVNIPSNLQKVWDDVSKDGKIDRADAQKLLKEAAPSLAKGGEIQIDQVNDELDDNERAFLSNFSNIKEGSSIAVKNGTAKGTFDFVDDTPVAQPQTKDQPKTDKTEGKQYFTPLTLPGSETKTEQPASTQETGKPSDNKDVEELNKLKELKANLPNVLQGDELTKQMAIVDGKIKTLEDKISKTQPAPANTETTTKDNAEGKTETAPADETDKPVPPPADKYLDDLKQLKEQLPKTLKEPELSKQMEVVDKKIFMHQAEKVGSEANYDDFIKDKEQIKKDFEALPESLKGNEDVKKAYDTAMAKVYSGAKAELFKKINTVIENATQEVLKTGNVDKFTDAKNEVEKLLDKYKDLENDPDFKKIKGILSGDIPIDDVRKNAYNNIHKAIDTVTSANDLLGKKDWSRNDTEKATEIVKDLPEGALKTKLEDRIKGGGTTSTGKSASAEKTTRDEAISDVMGKGLFNATNREGTEAIFQSLASKGELDDTIKRMTADDQKRLIKLLSDSNDGFSLAIARKVYDNMSQSANIDDDLNKKVLKKVKAVSPDSLDKFKVNEETFAKGLQYSVYSEKEAALTMARSILDKTVSPKVLSKFDSREISMLVDVVGKKGSKEEKEQLLQLLSGNNASHINNEFLSNKDKASIVRNTISQENFDESNLDGILNNTGKNVVLDMVKKESLTDKQLVMLAKHSDGDKMSDDTDVSSKMLAAMIRTYNKEPNGSNLKLADITKFIEQISHDRDKDEVMKKLISQLGDGPDSDYAKFKALAPATMDKIWNMSR